MDKHILNLQISYKYVDGLEESFERLYWPVWFFWKWPLFSAPHTSRSEMTARTPHPHWDSLSDSLHLEDSEFLPRDEFTSADQGSQKRETQ